MIILLLILEIHRPGGMAEHLALSKRMKIQDTDQRYLADGHDCFRLGNSRL